MSGQAGNDDEDCVKNISTKIDEGCDKYDVLFPSSARIFKVSESLRELNKRAYTPRLIAIGPLHRKDEHLQTPMQDIKVRYTDALIFRVAEKIGDDEKLGDDRKNYKVLRECIKKVKGCISDAKKFYADVDNARKYDAKEVTLVSKGHIYEAEEVTLVYKGQKCNAEEVKVVHKAGKYDTSKVTLVDEAATDEMLEMMLVDGCFILELLYLSHQRKKKAEAEREKKEEAKRRNPSGADNGNSKASSSILQGQDPIDPIFNNILTGAIVQQDLILLENQIPFFVLEHLFEVTVAMVSGAKRLSLEDYVRSYCREYYIKGPEYENSGSKKTSCFLPVVDCVLSVGDHSTKESAQAGKADDQYHHILHLLHDFWLPDDLPVENKQKKLCGLEVSASDLHYAGVNFAPAENNNLFNVEFEKPQGIRWWFHGAKFKIPTLNVDDSTETFLRNLIALEQCCPGVRRHFTSYAKFMDMLIDSGKDVDVLKKAGVIRNNLGADTDVACLFNNLCKEVVVGEFYFNDKYQDAYTYSKYSWPKWMAYWKRTYSASPWAFRAVVVHVSCL
ncbi:hypothetical protein C3L33_20617, partial [Rhododendron williamsianum]